MIQTQKDLELILKTAKANAEKLLSYCLITNIDGSGASEDNYDTDSNIYTERVKKSNLFFKYYALIESISTDYINNKGVIIDIPAYKKTFDVYVEENKDAIDKANASINNFMKAYVLPNKVLKQFSWVFPEASLTSSETSLLSASLTQMLKNIIYMYHCNEKPLLTIDYTNKDAVKKTFTINNLLDAAKNKIIGLTTLSNTNKLSPFRIERFEASYFNLEYKLPQEQFQRLLPVIFDSNIWFNQVFSELHKHFLLDVALPQNITNNEETPIDIMAYFFVVQMTWVIVNLQYMNHCFEILDNYLRSGESFITPGVFADKLKEEPFFSVDVQQNLLPTFFQIACDTNFDDIVKERDVKAVYSEPDDFELGIETFDEEQGKQAADSLRRDIKH